MSTQDQTGLPLIKKGVPLDDIIKTSATLDIVFFAGTGAMSSGIIWCEKYRKKLVEGEPIFSHCGVIIKGKDLDPHNLQLVEAMQEENFTIDEQETYIMEAQMTSKNGQLIGETKCHCGLAEYCTGCGTACDFWGCTCEKVIYGVLFRKLRDVIVDYDNSPDIIIHYGMLKENPFRVSEAALRDNPAEAENLYKYQQRVTHCYMNYRELPYDYGCCGINMFAVICRACRPCRLCITCGSTESAVVCSELVAMVYRDCGIVAANTRCQNVSPMDFLDYEQDSYGIPKGIIRKPTSLFTAYPDPEGQKSWSAAVVSQPKNQLMNKSLQSVKHREVGNASASVIEVELEDMGNIGIGDKNYKSVKSSTQRVLHDLYYRDGKKYQISDDLRSSGRTQVTLSSTRESEFKSLRSDN